MPFFSSSKPKPPPVMISDDEFIPIRKNYASLLAPPPTNPQCPPCPPCTRGGMYRRKTKSRRTRSKKRGGKKSRRRH